MRIKRGIYICICLFITGCTKAVYAALIIETNQVAQVYAEISTKFASWGYGNGILLTDHYENRTFEKDYNGVNLDGYFFASVYPDQHAHRVVVIFSQVENLEESFSNVARQELSQIEIELINLYQDAVRLVESKDEVERIRQFYWAKVRKDIAE